MKKGKNMSKRFLVIGFLSGILAGCATAKTFLKEEGPKAPADAAILAVDASVKSEKAALMACMTYKQGVYLGTFKPSAKADKLCNDLVKGEEPAPAVVPQGTEGNEINPEPATPTNHFPGSGTVPA